MCGYGGLNAHRLAVACILLLSTRRVFGDATDIGITGKTLGVFRAIGIVTSMSRLMYLPGLLNRVFDTDKPWLGGFFPNRKLL